MEENLKTYNKKPSGNNSPDGIGLRKIYARFPSEQTETWWRSRVGQNKGRAGELLRVYPSTTVMFQLPWLHNKSPQNLVSNNSNHSSSLIIFVGQEFRQGTVSTAYLSSVRSRVSEGRLEDRYWNQWKAHLSGVSCVWWLMLALGWGPPWGCQPETHTRSVHVVWAFLQHGVWILGGNVWRQKES